MTVVATEYSSAFGTEKKPFPFILTKDEFLKSVTLNKYERFSNTEYSALAVQWITCFCWLIRDVKVHHIFFSDGSEYELRLGVYEVFTKEGNPSYKFLKP
jgi:hypothetical protein